MSAQYQDWAQAPEAEAGVAEVALAGPGPRPLTRSSSTRVRVSEPESGGPTGRSRVVCPGLYFFFDVKSHFFTKEFTGIC